MMQGPQKQQKVVLTETPQETEGIMTALSEAMASTWGRLALGISGLSLAAGLTGCAKIPAGYGGILVDNAGSQRGAQELPVRTGFVPFNPITQEVHQFPTFLQQRTWTASEHEGRQGVDESITFNSSEGLAINCDIQVGYSIDFAKIPHIWVDFHKDIEQISDVTVHGWVRDEFSEVAGKMSVADIMGPKKAELQDQVVANLAEKYGHFGFNFQSVNIIGEMRVPESVKKSINAVIEARSNALAAENKVAESRAVAQQSIAKARGDSLSAVIQASGQANANEMINASLTDRVLAQHWLDRWNGEVSKVNGGNTMVGVPDIFKK